MKNYRLKIMTPEKRVYDGEVHSLTVNGENGQLTVLAGHTAMAAVLREGAVTVRTEQETLEGTGGDGLLWVEHNEAALMLHAFRWANEPEEVPLSEPIAEEQTML